MKPDNFLMGLGKKVRNVSQEERIGSQDNYLFSYKINSVLSDNVRIVVNLFLLPSKREKYM
jgi:hypothetical protein